MRNFWLDGEVDDRKTNLRGGPRNKEGGMTLNLYQKDRGTSLKVLQVNCYINAEGNVVTRVYNTVKNEVVTEIITEK